MAQRRSPHRVRGSSISPTFNSTVRNRKYSLRHPSATQRALAFVHRIQRPTVHSHASLASTSSSNTAVSVRPILATVQPNLRRLPSRQNILLKSNMRDVPQSLGVPIGSKRKRVVSISENAHAHGRPTRGSGRQKRFKSIVSQDMSSDDDGDVAEDSSMDVDSQRRWRGSDDSDAGIDCTESCKPGTNPHSFH